ncbi:NAD(P)-binding protein [Clavulina sp. PMI_390]|nr:NAD(P)-binding protein [Clavulina sp. PMI_390]
MASNNDMTFLVFGATGYIGGAVAVHYKKKYPSASFVAYTRSAKNVPALEKAGFKPLLSSGDPAKDDDLIIAAVKAADVVLNIADSDDLHLTKTILAAFETHDRKNGLPILIHTSGTGVLPAQPYGSFGPSAEKVYDDNNVDDIKSLAISQPHREIDVAIFDASYKRNSINYIIAPSAIYAPAHDNPVNKISIQIPSLIRLAIKRRQAVYGGEGTNKWSYVHIADLADLYQIVLEKALVDRATGANSTTDPYERFYFGSVTEHTFGDVVKQLGPILHARGLVDTPETTGIPVEEAPIATVMNSRSVANRSFKDGWNPKAPTWQETLEADVEAVLEHDKAS